MSLDPDPLTLPEVAGRSDDAPVALDPDPLTLPEVAGLAGSMGLDLGSFLAVPEPIRALAESNPLIGSAAAAVLVKVVAAGILLVLLARLRRGRALAVALVMAVTLVGALSNLRALDAGRAALETEHGLGGPLFLVTPAPWEIPYAPRGESYNYR